VPVAHSETSTDDGDPELTGPDGGSGSEGAGGGKKKHVDSPVNWPVFGTAAGLIIAFVLWAWLAPHSADTVINNVKDWIATNLGWFYVLTAGVVVVFVLVIAFRRTGNTKIGPDHSQPKFGLFTWGAMLFAAGIGVDLMFFGISGPATNYLTPPEGAGMSDEAARMAPLWTMFHYGIPGWAMYALMGMAFGLFAYRYHMPLSIRSALAPIFGRRIHGAPGHAVEIAASIGTAFGISVSLGIGVVFINYGLSELFGIPTSTGVQIALICLSVFITILSTVSGVDKGIRRLSELNVWLAVILMVWIVVMGKTADLLNSLVQNIGDFVSRFPSMMLNTFSYSEGPPTTRPRTGCRTGPCSSGRGGSPGHRSSACSSPGSPGAGPFASSSSVCWSSRSPSSPCGSPSSATRR
jgi:choline/glycine/proline betaine transport protein